MSRLSHKSSGVVLVLVLWVLSILVVLAIGLGRSTSIELALTRYKLARLKAKYVAWGGLFFALHEIKKDTYDKDSSQLDSLYQCAVKLDQDESIESVFKEVALGEGSFSMSYSSEDKDGKKKEFWGFVDEERKININAVTINNEVITRLLIALGIESNVAQSITNAILDWKDPDSTPTDPSNGAEEDYYQSSGKKYHCKNLPFDTIDELLLLKDVTPEIFHKIHAHITVYPKDASVLLININTASAVVLTALAESYSGAATNTDLSDAKSLVDKILHARLGDDGLPQTRDDPAVDLAGLGLNPKESAIFLSMQKNITTVSKYISVRIKGVESNTKALYQMNAVVFRDDLSIVSLRQNADF